MDKYALIIEHRDLMEEAAIARQKQAYAEYQQALARMHLIDALYEVVQWLIALITGIPLVYMLCQLIMG